MFDGFLRGERGQDLKIAGAGQRYQEALHRVRIGRLHDQQQDMLPVDKRLGLDGDAIAGGNCRRDSGKQQLSPTGQGRAVFGRVPVLRDEQSDESLLLAPPPQPPLICQPALSAGVGTQTRADKLPGQNVSEG